jgi:hypothetical protein
MKTKFSRNTKSRVKKKKKPTDSAMAEESNDEKQDDEEDQTQLQMIQESNEEYLALKARMEAGENISKKQLFLQRPPNNVIVLNYGPIPGRVPTIFFNYPSFLKMQRPFKQDRIQMITQEQLQPYSYLTFRIARTHVYNCVINALKTAGFHLVTSGNGPCSWNSMWSNLIRPSKLKHMNQY